MAKRLKLKRSVKEALIAIGIFVAIMATFWRVVLFGYPSDLETGMITGMFITAFISFIFKGGKNDRKHETEIRSGS